MKIPNKRLLEEFRVAGNCDWCKRRCSIREPAHLIHSGSGGCPLDIRCNIVSLGSTRHWECCCHHSHHLGNEPSFYDLLTIVAEREDCMQADVERVIRLFRRLDKDRWQQQLRAEKLNPAQRRLVRQTVDEMPKSLLRSA